MDVFRIARGGLPQSRAWINAQPLAPFPLSLLLAIIRARLPFEQLCLQLSDRSACSPVLDMDTRTDRAADIIQ